MRRSRVLKEILELSEHTRYGARSRSSLIFTQIDDILNKCSNPVRETTVVFLGLTGKCVRITSVVFLLC